MFYNDSSLWLLPNNIVSFQLLELLFSLSKQIHYFVEQLKIVEKKKKNVFRILPKVS